MAAATADPVIWIIATGTEILQGESSDRNSPWLSARLLELGLSTARHMALPDHAGLLRAGLAEAAREADLVITTGGLGPTGDDLNRQLIAELWDSPLVQNEEALERIRERFRRRGREMSPSNVIQSHVPAAGKILQNDHGTAAGFYLEPTASGPRAAILALPGPPREMQPMFDGEPLRWISARFAGGRGRPRTLTLHTIGLPESQIDDQVRELFESDPRVIFALLARPANVDIRMTFFGRDDYEAARLEIEWRERVLKLVGESYIFGENIDTLESVVGRLLRERGQTLATAESCTAGLLAARLTDAEGTSAFFAEGLVTYSNEAKQARLGVDRELLARHGAVSPEVAMAMAQGARATAGADWGIGITGIAGPGGGSPEKPVGLVYFGLAGPELPALAIRQLFSGDRAHVRYHATQTALELLRRALLGLPLE